MQAGLMPFTNSSLGMQPVSVTLLPITARDGFPSFRRASIFSRLP